MAMDPIAQYEEALSLLDEGREEEAVRKYLSIINMAGSADKVLPSVYNDLGVITYKSNRLEEAMEFFRKSSERNPSHTDLRENLKSITGTLQDFMGIYERSNGIEAKSPFVWGMKSKFYTENVIKELLPLIPIKAARILDIGCGEGELAHLIRQRNRNAYIIGIDKDEGALQRAKNVIDKVFRGDIEKIDFLCPENFFDTIIYDGVLEHVNDPWRLLKSHKKYLSEEGTIIAAVPNVQHFSVLLEILGGKWNYKKEGVLNFEHLRFFTYTELRETFKNSGFIITEIKGNRTYPLPEKFKELFRLIKPLNIISDNFELETQSYFFTLCAKKAQVSPQERESIIGYTGERMVPAVSDWSMELQHQVRYNFFKPLAANRIILDAGCGVGYGTHALSRLALEAHGIDNDADSVEHAKSRYQGENLLFHNMDLLKIQEKSRYERIFAFEVIEQVEDYRELLRVMKESLKGDGIFILSASNRIDASQPSNPFHRNEWSARELQKLLEEYFDNIYLLGQSHSCIKPIQEISKVSDDHLIAICSALPLPDIYGMLERAWTAEKTSLIIPTFNNLDYTKQCLASVLRYTYDPCGIVLVDNCSSDGTGDYVLAQYNMPMIILPGNKGFWEACSEGIKATSSKYVAIMHNDVVVSHNWIGKLLATLSMDEKNVIAGPCTNRARGDQMDTVVYDSMDEFLAYSKSVEEKHFEKYRYTEMIDNFCFVMKREVADKLGFADVSSFGKFKKFLHRIKTSGFEIVVREDTFVHHIKKL